MDTIPQRKTFRRQIGFTLLTWVVLAPLSGACAGLLSTPFDAVFGRHKEVAPVDNPVYAEECGACHLAYPPGLLPGRSWAKLMEAQSLEDHFGDDATLDEATRIALAAYLAGASADESWRKRAIKVRQSIPEGETPLRISEVPYIKRAHRELDAEAVKANSNIKSFAQCNRCHRRAERGVFDDDTVKIPKPGGTPAPASPAP